MRMNASLPEMEASPSNEFEEALGAIARFAAGPQPEQEDILALMILFHTHRITFMRPIWSQRPSVKRLTH